MFTYVAFLSGYISIYVRNCVPCSVLFAFNYNRSDYTKYCVKAPDSVLRAQCSQTSRYVVTRFVSQLNKTIYSLENFRKQQSFFQACFNL